MKALIGFFLALLFSSGLYAETLSIDTLKSELIWTGKKVTGKHYGEIRLKEGLLNVDNNIIISGKFIIDMNTITCEDLPEGSMNEKLVNHLKSDDFFSVDKYPEAILVIEGSVPVNEGKILIKGNLTIKGITKPVEFNTTYVGKTYTATVTVDRSEFDVRYGSGRFFQNLGNNLIYDDFIINVKIALN